MDEGNLQYIADDKLFLNDSDDEEEYQPMPNENIIDNNFKDDNEEYCLNMLYDNALDDGPTLIDKPPCLVVTKLCEDKNDILAVCDGTLTHESPTLFLNSPSYTMETQY